MADKQHIFSVDNKHKPNAGQPPQIDGNVKSKYYGYFENEYGEQMIFVYDHALKLGIVWVGDAGWEKSYKVVDGLVPELMLSDKEETWLQVCWNAATALEQE
jgi:hypothetical protein